MTHIFLLGSWGQEGKLPDLPPPFLFSHWGLFLETPEGDSVPPSSPLLLGVGPCKLDWEERLGGRFQRVRAGNGLGVGWTHPSTLPKKSETEVPKIKGPAQVCKTSSGSGQSPELLASSWCSFPPFPQNQSPALANSGWSHKCQVNP